MPYNKFIERYTKGIQLYPIHARLYRHLGLCYLATCCFYRAIAEFQMAAQLIKSTTDELKPNSRPDAQNSPTSTLQSNIWYHLGLAYYLQGDFLKAEKDYRKCLKALPRSRYVCGRS